MLGFQLQPLEACTVDATAICEVVTPANTARLGVPMTTMHPFLTSLDVQYSVQYYCRGGEDLDLQIVGGEAR
jgi:hypothetical protein